MAGSKTGADFLKIPTGARNVALGQTYSALSYGPDALNGNVAGILEIPSPYQTSRGGLSFSHQNRFVDTTIDQVDLVLPGENHAWGFSVLRLGIPDQQGRAADRTPTGTVGAGDMAVGAAIARTVGKYKVGSQLKFIRQDLAGYRAQGVALDLGFLAPTPFSRISIGGMVRNLGPKMQFIEEEFNLPLAISLGTAYQITGPLVLGLDITSRPYEHQTAISFGTEFHTLNNVTLRAGYLSRLSRAVVNHQRSESERGNLAGLNGLTTGLGLAFKTFSIDYAFSQFGELGFTHALTVGTWFGGNAVPAELMAQKAPVSLAPQTVKRVVVIFNLPDASPPWWEIPN